MNITTINEAFNEALEEIGEGPGNTFSMEFVQHHEAELERRITRYRNQNSAQNMAFLLLLAGLILALRKGLINTAFIGLGSNVFTGLFFLWILIALNSILIGRRNKKMAIAEKQLMLMGVYRKIMAKNI